MSEENPQKPTVEARDEAMSTVLPQGFELVVNKATNEITVKDSAGNAYTLKATVIEEDEEEEEVIESKPLSPEEFQSVLRRLKELGLTWTADVPPLPRFKELSNITPERIEEYRKMQKAYRSFPRELGAVILYALTGRPQSPTVVGSKSELEEKSAIIENEILSKEYRADFFFKYAIKVPYFEDVDWEVVVKAYERGTRKMPRSAYALLSLALRNPINTTLPLEEGAMQDRDLKFITVAANESLIDILVKRLTAIKEALIKAQFIADTLTDESISQEEQASEHDS